MELLLLRTGGLELSNIVAKIAKALKIEKSIKSLTKVLKEVRKSKVFKKGVVLGQNLRAKYYRYKNLIQGNNVVWKYIKATQEVYPGTRIPRSFEITVAGKKFWVSGSGTKHLEEVFLGVQKKVSVSPFMLPMTEQGILTSFYNELRILAKRKYTIDKLENVQLWEFKIGNPRGSGQFPAIYHAVFRPDRIYK